MSRPVTPPRKNPNGSTTYVTQRCCDGCGRELGDVRLGEIEQYLATGRLPSVIDECGCAAAEGVSLVPSRQGGQT